MNTFINRKTLLNLIPSSELAMDAALSGPALEMIKVLGAVMLQPPFNACDIGVSQLSGLLWSAAGRHQTAGPVLPTPCQGREIDLYVATQVGVYRYEPQSAQLALVAADDVRDTAALTATAGSGAISLIYVANLARVTVIGEGDRLYYAALDVGAMSQNVVLLCVAQNLISMINVAADNAEVTRVLSLGADARIMLVQTVGHSCTEPCSNERASWN